jgi:hypothetical protein
LECSCRQMTLSMEDEDASTPQAAAPPMRCAPPVIQITAAPPAPAAYY